MSVQILSIKLHQRFLNTITKKRPNLHFKTFVWAFGLALWFVASFKLLGPDNDYKAYVDYIRVSYSIEFGLLEPAFRFIVYLNSIIFNSNPYSVFAILAGLSLLIKFKSILKLSNYPIFCLLLYILGYYLLHEYTQVRVAVASAIFLSSISDIEEKNVLKFGARCVAAIMFHYSAVIMILIYLFVVYLPRNWALATPLIGYLVYLLNINSLEILNSIGLSEAVSLIISMRTGYQEKINPFNILSLGYYLIFIIGLVLALNSKLTSIDLVLLKIAGFSISIFFILSSAMSPVLAFRVFEFLNLTSLVLASNLPRYFKNKLPVFVGVFIFFAAQLYYFVTKVWI